MFNHKVLKAWFLFKPSLIILVSSLAISSGILSCSLATKDRKSRYPEDSTFDSRGSKNNSPEKKQKAVPLTGEIALEGSAEAERPSTQKVSLEPEEIASVCREWMKKIPGGGPEALEKVCGQTHVLKGCESRKGTPIFHYDRLSQRPNGEKILTFALIHGDELPSGSVAKVWMERLSEIDPRNSWRVVPILNPDGMTLKTRMNGNKVDLNRNFPSRDWDELAVKYWREKTKSDPRRFPGDAGGSEPETQCAMNHIEDFKPDLIISIHTPYGVLDFDGPKMAFPQFRGLPWVSLGTFPGSLGRYMWTDRHKPVLTIELKQDLKSALEDFDQLQDISGKVALMIKQRLK